MIHCFSMTLTFTSYTWLAGKKEGKVDITYLFKLQVCVIHWAKLTSRQWNQSSASQTTFSPAKCSGTFVDTAVIHLVIRCILQLTYSLFTCLSLHRSYKWNKGCQGSREGIKKTKKECSQWRAQFDQAGRRRKKVTFSRSKHSQS